MKLFSAILFNILMSFLRDRGCGEVFIVIIILFCVLFWGCLGPFQNAPTNIIPDILLERIITNGQRNRRMADSHGLIWDSSEMVFPQH